MENKFMNNNIKRSILMFAAVVIVVSVVSQSFAANKIDEDELSITDTAGYLSFYSHFLSSRSSDRSSSSSAPAAPAVFSAPSSRAGSSPPTLFVRPWINIPVRPLYRSPFTPR